MLAEVLQCNCKHEGQDKLHGYSNRVFNEEVKGRSQEYKSMKCTVCGTTKRVKK